MSSEDEDEREDLDEDDESYSEYDTEDEKEDSEAANYDWRQDENCYGEKLTGKLISRNIARAKQKMKSLTNMTPEQVERLNNVDPEDTSGKSLLGALLGSGEEYEEALSLYRHSELECGDDCHHCQESMDLLTADMMRTLRVEDREKYEEMMKAMGDKPRSL